MINQPFYDRNGKEHYASDIIPVKQKGYFAILVKDNKVLITYPPLVDLPEFPGGAVGRREDFRECLYRKLYEETGIEFMLDYGSKEFKQEINYFADDARPYGEYCIYDMTFIVYDASSYGFATDGEMWKTPENGQANWVNIADILAGKCKINFIHQQAINKLFAQD